MPYRQMTPNDIWVDDPGSPDYNRLKKRGETQANHSRTWYCPMTGTNTASSSNTTWTP